MKPLLALLFSCAVCLGQLPVIPFVTQPSGSVDIPALQGSIFLRWNEKDLSGTQAVGKNVTNWIDRILGVAANQGNVAATPTNAALGVHFNGSQNLTNTPVKVCAVSNAFMIIYYTDQLNAAGAFISDADGFGQFLETSSQQWWYESGVQLAKPLPLNAYQDLIWAGDPHGTGSSTAYTNGVASKSAAVGSGFNIAGIGGHSGAFYSGYIAEIIIWTNTVGPFTTTQISNLHYYRTNLAVGGWGGSP